MKKVNLSFLSKVTEGISTDEYSVLCSLNENLNLCLEKDFLNIRISDNRFNHNDSIKIFEKNGKIECVKECSILNRDMRKWGNFILNHIGRIYV